ncbi:S53 family peptidase [Luedemannella flava]|uniref:S53 family peptidase n=1 Tax=Luedemannella flava TaxID=349316 RepID=A0ABN2M672_9ACTN
MTVNPASSGPVRRVPLSGSRRAPLPGAHRIGPTDPATPVDVTVVLRRAPADPRPGTGADPDDIAAIERFAATQGLEVTDVRPAARSVGLRGPAEAMSRAFGVDLVDYEIPGGAFRGRVGVVRLPADLAPAVVAVLGLDDRPQASPQVRLAGRAKPGGDGFVVAHAAASGLKPTEIARWYDFPTDVTGAGQTVAVIELGGGYRQEDLDAYFASLGLPVPAIVPVGVDGATNAPGAEADAEVALDVQVIGAMANGVKIVVYFAPNSARGFYDAIAAAIHDADHHPWIVSISWGAPEPTWTAQSLDAYDALFADAGELGVTVYAAAGDHGATDGVAGGGLHVDFPSSSPSVIACGGTRLADDPGAEAVWNALATGGGATGGGVSAHFPLPDYQRDHGVPARPDGSAGRGVPDVAAVADPATGYVIRLNDADVVAGGTSAVSPLWSALTALTNERSRVRSGAPHKRLYAAPTALRDILTGGNGGFTAGPGWDGCTGLGVPAGEQTVTALSATVDPTT